MTPLNTDIQAHRIVRTAQAGILHFYRDHLDELPAYAEMMQVGTALLEVRT